MSESNRQPRPRTAAIPVNGPELRRLRMERGMEMADLAALVGVSRKFIGHLELGQPDGTPRRASVTVYARLLRVFDLGDHDALRADAAPRVAHGSRSSRRVA